jgi:hypothetical protein
MGKKTLILKKATKYASSRMLMDISGKDLTGIFKSIMFNKIEWSQGTQLFKVTRCLGADR